MYRWNIYGNLIARNLTGRYLFLKFEIQVHDISKSMHTSSLVPDFDEENEFITVVVKVIYARRKKRRRARVMGGERCSDLGFSAR